jgi:hypothetical protein
MDTKTLMCISKNQCDCLSKEGCPKCAVAHTPEFLKMVSVEKYLRATGDLKSPALRQAILIVFEKQNELLGFPHEVMVY